MPHDQFVPVISVPLLLEYEDVLTRFKEPLNLTTRDIEAFLDYYVSISYPQKIHYLWRPLLRDAKDDMVLEAAFNGNCAYVVTFNTKDFRAARQLGINAITPGEFLGLLQERSAT
jgi:predicted nucleic acid-binding protein